MTDNITVQSPQIDAIKVSTEHISHWLHKDFKEIVKPLQNLEALPALFSSLESRLVEQFRHSLSGQIAVSMKTTEANIRVAEQRGSVVQNEIKQKENDFVHDNENTTKRHNERIESLNQHHETFIHELDSHAFDITEKIYPDQVQSKFSFISQPFWQELAKHINKLAYARSSALLESLKETIQSLNKFVDMRKTVYKELRALTVSESIQDGSYDLPYWYLVVEDVATKQQHIEVFFDWESQNINLDDDQTVENNLKLSVGGFATKDKFDELRQVIIKQVRLEIMAPLDQINKNNIIAHMLKFGISQQEVDRFISDCKLFGS
jgi:hypothetical protein